MIGRWASDFRLVPVVLLATIALLVLKVSGLMFDGGYTLAERLEERMTSVMPVAAPPSASDRMAVPADGHARQADAGRVGRPWAEEMFNYNRGENRDITGSVDKAKEGEAPSPKAEDKLKVSEKPPGPPKVEAGGAATTIEPGHINSAGERALIASLHDRRQQLDARSRDLDMRENLLKAAEKRVEAKVAELKNMEAQVKTELGNRDKAEAQQLKGLITMYETMKPKEAARIFDRLDMKILVEVSTQMNPRTMSSILAQMSPEAAERLTVELANRAGGSPLAPNPKQLPKIEGKPSAR
jgi:flagellar motility protein MotE (MotC chaperone)